MVVDCATQLLLCCVYSQGLPLLLCGLTALIDLDGKGRRGSELQSHPEVGKYHCYLGSEKTAEYRSYFTTPQFIYQQSVIILVQLSNLGFLLHTGFIIRSRVLRTRSLRSRGLWVSSWHNGAACPYAIKNQGKARNVPSRLWVP